MRKYILKTGILCALLLNAACSTEYSEGDNKAVIPEPGKKVRLELITNAGEYELPVTRTGSADENGLDRTPWVIVFHGTGDSASFFELAKSIRKDTQTLVDLEQTSSPCRVLVIANAPETFYNGSSEVAFNAENLRAFLASAATFSVATSRLETAYLSSPKQTSVPYASTEASKPFIPMTATLDLPKIDAGTTIGTPSNQLILTRIVAKVSVEAAPNAIILLGATVVNAPRNSRFFNIGSNIKDNTGSLTDYLATTTGEVTDISASTNNSTILNPIYLYESRAQENTSVIIKAQRFGSISYYRLVFKNTNETAATDVLRNKYYRFVINKVFGNGYETFAEAKAKEPSNIEYTVTVTDQMSHDIIDNGKYYLGLSNSQLNIYTPDIDQNILAFTITTNAPQGTPNSIEVTSNLNNITLSTSTINIATSPGAIATTDVRISLGNSLINNNELTIKLGNIIKKAIVRKMASISGSGSTIQLGSGYTFAAVADGLPWLSVSGDATNWVQKIDLLESGNVYLKIDRNTGQSRTGHGYLNANFSGRVKLLIKQDTAN